MRCRPGAAGHPPPPAPGPPPGRTAASAGPARDTWAPDCGSGPEGGRLRRPAQRHPRPPGRLRVMRSTCRWCPPGARAPPGCPARRTRCRPRPGRRPRLPHPVAGAPATARCAARVPARRPAGQRSRIPRRCRALPTRSPGTGSDRAGARRGPAARDWWLLPIDGGGWLAGRTDRSSAGLRRLSGRFWHSPRARTLRRRRSRAIMPGHATIDISHA